MKFATLRLIADLMQAEVDRLKANVDAAYKTCLEIEDRLDYLPEETPYEEVQEIKCDLAAAEEVYRSEKADYNRVKDALDDFLDHDFR